MFDTAGEFDHAVSEMEGFGGEVGAELFDGFEQNFHIFGDIVAGDDDGLVKFVIVPFGEGKAEIFGFVGGEALGIDEYTGVEAVFFAIENDGTVGFFVDAVFLLLFDGF